MYINTGVFHPRPQGVPYGNQAGHILKHTPSVRNSRIYRFLLKIGSIAFLLFFALIAPAAPAVVQLGSAFYLIWVLVFSFSSSDHVADRCPAPPDTVLCRSAAGDFEARTTAVAAFAADKCPVAPDRAMPEDPPIAGVILPVAGVPPPDTGRWRLCRTISRCCPVRAGPVACG